jgi:hypothetical protein
MLVWLTLAKQALFVQGTLSRYRATKSISEITGNIRVLFLSRVRSVHAWCVALCTLPYDNTLCWANLEFLMEIVTNFLPMFSTDSLFRKRSAELLYTSYILYKIVCSNLYCVFIRTYSLCVSKHFKPYVPFDLVVFTSRGRCTYFFLLEV